MNSGADRIKVPEHVVDFDGYAQQSAASSVLHFVAHLPTAVDVVLSTSTCSDSGFLDQQACWTAKGTAGPTAA